MNLEPNNHLLFLQMLHLLYSFQIVFYLQLPAPK